MNFLGEGDSSDDDIRLPPAVQPGLVPDRILRSGTSSIHGPSRSVISQGLCVIDSLIAFFFYAIRGTREDHKAYLLTMNPVFMAYANQVLR